MDEERIVKIMIKKTGIEGFRESKFFKDRDVLEEGKRSCFMDEREDVPFWRAITTAGRSILLTPGLLEADFFAKDWIDYKVASNIQEAGSYTFARLMLSALIEGGWAKPREIMILLESRKEINCPEKLDHWW